VGGMEFGVGNVQQNMQKIPNDEEFDHTRYIMSDNIWK